MNPAHNFFQLPKMQRHALIKAFLLLGLIRLGLWLVPFRKLYQWLVRWSEPISLPVHPPSPSAKPVRLAIWAVETSCIYMPTQPKCLARALAVFFLVRRRGMQPSLKIGVMKSSDQGIAAHAWIEIDGQAVIGELPNLNDYIPLPSLEGANL